MRMTTDRSITIYHFDDETDEFHVSFCGRASVYVLDKIKPDERGRIFDSGAKIRIPVSSLEDVAVSVGDYIFIGETKSEKLNKADCYHILSVTKNYKGVNPHIKIFAV